jgi:hypothetical protein
VARIAESAVIVTTGDQFHHGIGHGTPPKDAHEVEPDGLSAARSSMEEGMRLIERGDYWGYNQHCVIAKSDDRDVAQLFRYLRGPLQGTLLEIGYSDMTELYDQPSPTWAGGGFMKFERIA